MTASAMRTYLNRYGVAAGRKVAVFTNGSSGYETARDLAAAGIEVAALVDSRGGSEDVLPSGIRRIAGGSVIDTKGGLRIKAIRLDRSGFDDTIACDALAMSGGWSPVIHLLCQRGAGLHGPTRSSRSSRRRAATASWRRGRPMGHMARAPAFRTAGPRRQKRWRASAAMRSRSSAPKSRVTWTRVSHRSGMCPERNPRRSSTSRTTCM